MSFDQNIRDILLQKIHEINPDIYVVEMELHRSKISVLRILIDTDEGINISDCRAVSRNISRYLEGEEEEGNEIFNFRYNLEVGSPGVGRPLKLLRQYHKNVGRDLKVKLLEGEEVKGKLTEVQDGFIFLLPQAKKKGKKGSTPKKEDVELLKIDFEDIKEAKVLVSFK